MGIARAGGYLLIGLFFVLVVYFVLSTPLEIIFDTFDDIEDEASGDEMNIHLPWIRTALNMAFSVAIAAPLVIFVMRTFERDEPQYRYPVRGRRYRR